MNDNLSVIRQEENTLAKAAPPMDIEGMFRYAIEKGGGVETMERLMTIRRELNQEQAKSAYDRSMAAFQAECPVVNKPKGVRDNNGNHAYSFAPFEHVIQTVRPVLEKHGFSYTLDTDTESKDGWVIAKCKVTHSGGHSETSTAKFPLGAGTRIMSTTQIYAAALTFASRRVFQNAFGIVCAGEDTIEQGLKQKPSGPSSVAPDNTALKSLASELWTLLKPVRGPEQNWKEANQWLWDNAAIPDNTEAPHLTVEQFKSAILKAKGKIRV